jgi:hypothetical protein
MLCRLGLRGYGMSDNYVLLEAGPSAVAVLDNAGLEYREVELTPDLPAYLVFLRRSEMLSRISALAPILLQDAKLILTQMDENVAGQVAQLGGELIRLPEKPFLLQSCPRATFPTVAFPDTFVQRIVNQVSADSIRRQIQRLQDFRTRSSNTDSCRAAEQYVFDYFTTLGLDSVALDSYDHQGSTWRNVIGTRLGRINPQRMVIVCGHMDCTSEDPLNNAPGAEDNGSGTVMAMEAARILTHEQMDITVKFIAFTGEEQGLLGSQHYAQMMRSQGADIIGAFNFDMISWPGGYFGVEIYCNQPSLPLALYETEMAQMYTTLGSHVTVGSYGSDQLSFQSSGYAATAGGEYGEFYPYYHTSADTLGNLSMSLAAEVAKMSVAAVATLGVVPAPPDSFNLYDAGTGGSLLARWQPNLEPDLAGYKLCWGADTLNYADSIILGMVNSYPLTGLTNGTRYYAELRAFDSSAHEGLATPRASAVPGITPLAPAGFTGRPIPLGMSLFWVRNTERDLAGYNLYRSTTPGTNYQRLNSAPLLDSVYSDTGLMSDTMYYYVVTAIDTNAHESGYAPEVRGKPITFDHGILLVDETRDGTGQPGSPNDAQVDSFYHAMLAGFHYTDWDVTQQGPPLAGDIGPYSTIVWHGDDLQDLRASPAVPGLANYLAYGGRLWMTGWKPIFNLMDQSGGYPFSFRSGQFAYDYLHLSRAKLSAIPDFTGATGIQGYPSVTIDSLKALRPLHGKLVSIEAYLPRDADTILKFVSASSDTGFDGRPVGIRWLNGPYKVVFFGFPFYYSKTEEARPVALKVMQDLGEPYAVDEVPIERALVQITAQPNPFHGATKFRFALTRPGHVCLSVYDVAGKLVTQLMNGRQPAGEQWTTWNGHDDKGVPVPAGVYFYRLTTTIPDAGKTTFTGKVELVR